MSRPDRILSVLLAGILVCFLLTGCSKSAPSQDKPVDNGVANTVVPAGGEKSEMPGGGPPKK